MAFVLFISTHGTDQGIISALILQAYEIQELSFVGFISLAFHVFYFVAGPRILNHVIIL